ncbi:MAG: FAD-dependent oxidoreductase [Bacteroidales bacterium]|nr:FAD-dependent oxidoreductase [Bacteroidales bacterium]
MENTNYDAIILGGGPAGLTSGIYLARAKANVLIIDNSMIGGQTILTHEIANYPGIENTSGFMLANTMKKQAENFGCTIKSNAKVERLILDSDQKSIILSNGESYTAKAIILATGGRSRMVGAKGEQQFKGMGISYCATCDGDFFTNKEIIVIGGGNSALEEAVSLTNYASKVTVVHQFDHFQAFQHAIDEAKSNSKIDFIMESKITEFKGEGGLQEAEIEHIPTGKKEIKPINGAFIFIGYEAQTEILHDTPVKLNDRKEILVDSNMQTNIEGVYAAGDSLAKRFRQITTAVADGTIAALSALEYIHKK